MYLYDGDFHLHLVHLDQGAVDFGGFREHVNQSIELEACKRIFLSTLPKSGHGAAAEVAMEEISTNWPDRGLEGDMKRIWERGRFPHRSSDSSQLWEIWYLAR